MTVIEGAIDKSKDVWGRAFALPHDNGCVSCIDPVVVI